MTSNPEPDPPPTLSPSRAWAWLVLALASAWAGLARSPLVLNAGAHLDSDLAVDGLALIDALGGHWRWHYPATPFIGSPPVLLSWPQAKIWGPTPAALASGGVVAYGLVVASTFLLNRRAFGPSVAAWGLVPLAFASTGTTWLSGRVTGGHLLATAWHAGAFALLWGVLTRGGWRRSALLGLWCGFGLYIDSMFAATWAGLAVAVGVFACLTPREGPPSRGKRAVRGVACLLAFGLAAGLGVAPRVVGARVDPHDAYVGQFEPVTRGDLVARNAGVLLLDCLPRLIAGHRLPRLEAEPDPSRLPMGSPSSPEKGPPWLGLSVAVASLGLFGWAMARLVVDDRKAAGVAARVAPARSATRWGLVASSMAVLAGFLVHPSITNSDNYRYLVFWLVPWSTGFGLLMARVGSRRPLAAWALALGFAGLMTVDSARWYARLGWVDSSYRPARVVVADPALDWLEGHPEVSTILGDYWDVYRLSFLTGGRALGVPFPQYPDRFPEIRRGLSGSRQGSRVVVVRPGGPGPLYRARAMAMGAREVGRGEGLSIVEWPGGMTP